MMQSWKEVLPGDHYIACSDGLLHFYDQKVITCLYQPLVGLEASSLYFTLWQEQQLDAKTVTMTHHHLMGVMNLSLDRILTARKKLEAIGLLRTLKKRNADPALFRYELKPPLAPAQFFTDKLLPVFLYQQIGARDYERLSRLFTKESVPAGEFDDLSAAFDDVFESIPASEKPPVTEAADWTGRGTSTPIHFRKPFNFKALISYLSDAIVSEDALTDEVRKVVEQLAFVYQTDPYDMSRAIEAASLHTGVVDQEVLRQEVRDFYRIEHGPGEMPALAERTQPAEAREMSGKEPQTEEEKDIARFESLSPYQILEQLGNGGKPAASDLRLVENLIMDMKLNPGVVGVLLAYVSRINQHKLTKAFVESIAASWARAGIQTVRQAMDIARQEKKQHDSLQQSNQPAGRKNTKARSSRPQQHQEVIPEWMKQAESGNSAVKKPEITPEEAQKRAKWLEDYLNSI
ncbi:MAG: DnaD domain protein [Sporolactobacillus sp.]